MRIPSPSSVGTLALAGVLTLTTGNLAWVLTGSWRIWLGTPEFDPPSTRIMDAGDVWSLADQGAGRCRYVVIANPDCAACQSASRNWRNELRRGRVSLPEEGWEVFWLVTQGKDGLDRLELPDPSFESFSLAHDQDALARLGVQAFPWHIVLGGDGAVVSSGSGARLPPRDSFNDDCSIDPPSLANAEVIG